MENQCADARSLGMCEYQEYPGQDLGFGDLQITARSKSEVWILIHLLTYSIMQFLA